MGAGVESATVTTTLQMLNPYARVRFKFHVGVHLKCTFPLTMWCDSELY